ncbi:hypothetical protein AWC29_26980 [Mycobacterium triplex]|uniref:Uncharacterized protein n=1 Tax=Mycobacterium triplex TaxID=47839 RepID=A0ABX3VXB6_9MYCO|nr:hypothetical protein AWC29_26980 [Mycobacterium triplex]
MSDYGPPGDPTVVTDTAGDRPLPRATASTPDLSQTIVYVFGRPASALRDCRRAPKWVDDSHNCQL